jgi:hypothetical protein
VAMRGVEYTGSQTAWRVAMDRVGIGQRETKGTRMNEGRSETGQWLLGNARKRMERQAGPRLPAFRQGSASGIYTSSPGGRDTLRYAETVSTSRRWEKEKGKGESESPAGDRPRRVVCERRSVFRVNAENEW